MAPMNGASGRQRTADQLQRQWQVVDRVERADRDDEVVALVAEVEAVFVDLSSAGRAANSGPGSMTSTSLGELAEPCGQAGPGSRSARRARIGARCHAAARGNRRTRDRRGTARARCARRGRGAGRAVGDRTGRGSRRALVRRRSAGRQGGNGKRLPVNRSSCRNALLDFALPPRCAGCGEIDRGGRHISARLAGGRSSCLAMRAASHAACRSQATEADTCGRCLAEPPRSSGCAPRSPMTTCRDDRARASNMGARSRWRGPWRATWRR